MHAHRLSGSCGIVRSCVACPVRACTSLCLCVCFAVRLRLRLARVPLWYDDAVAQRRSARFRWMRTEPAAAHANTAMKPANASATDASPSLPHPRSAALLCRVSGPDPQRRKVSHASFFDAHAGTTTLTNSATLFLGRKHTNTGTGVGTATHDDAASTPLQLQVFAACSADILVPFLHPSSRSTRRPELISGARIDILVESASAAMGVLGPAPSSSSDPAAEQWWACELHTLGEVEGVEQAVEVLSQSGPTWELGWSKPNYPPPLFDARARPVASSSSHEYDPRQSGALSDDSTPQVQRFGGFKAYEQSAVLYPNGRKRSAGQVAILRVLRPRAEIDAEAEAAKRNANSSSSLNASAATPAPTASAVTVWPSFVPPVTPATFPAFELHSWLRSCCGPVPRGTPVSITSSPFGLLSPTIFFNTLTRGIVANYVSVPDRSAPAAALASSTSHFGRAREEQCAASTLLHTPPSLLLLDARCFSGSEGAPVLLGPGVAACSTCSSSAVHPSPAVSALLGLVTLPLRHTQRGSAVELTLAIPAPRLHAFITRVAGLQVWEAPVTALAPTAAAAALSGSSGRGEGWRMMQGVRRRSQLSSASSSVSSHGIAALLTTANAAASAPASTPSTAAATLPSSQLASLPVASASNSPSKASSLMERLSFSSSSFSAAAALPASSHPPHVSCSPPIFASAVEHAERSVLMAKIGTSWASAIVLTEDGYLISNAHLVRPFLAGPPPTTQTTATTSEFAPRLPLLYDSAICLQSFAQVLVRVDLHHFNTADATSSFSSASDDSSRSGGGGAWLPARVVYISQGGWDVCLLKIECDQPLCPVSFHPAALASEAAAPAHPEEQLPPLGSDVIVIGHALFSPASSLMPTVTAGVLGKVVRMRMTAASPASPVLLSSTAAVHNGNSGGALVSADSGLFLGMTTSNVMHSPLWPHHFPARVRVGRDSYEQDPARLAELAAQDAELERREEEARTREAVSIIFPHLNFTTPYTALLPLRQFCLGGATDTTLLQAIDETPARLSRLWQLQELDPIPAPEAPLNAKYHALFRQLQEQEAQRNAASEAASAKVDSAVNKAEEASCSVCKLASKM